MTEPVIVPPPSTPSAPAPSVQPSSMPPMPDPAPELPVARSWVVRHRPWLVGAAIAVLSIGSGVGIAAAVSDSTTTGHAVASAPATQPAGAPAASASSGVPAKRQHGTPGVIMAESGSQWTVRTVAGQTITVMVTPQTQFGTKKSPAVQSDFPVGKAVVITGSVSNGSVAATRIAVHSPKGKAPTTNAPAAPTPSAGPPTPGTTS